MQHLSRQWLWAYRKARSIRLTSVEAAYRATRFALFGNSGRMTTDLGQKSRRFIRSDENDV